MELNINVTLILCCLFLFENCFCLLVDENGDQLLMQLKQDVQLMKAKQAELERENNQLKAKIQGGLVGFTAKYTRTENKVLVFSSIVTNEGIGYNTTTGKFTCPISGLYLFHLNIVTSTPGTATIMKNGVGIIRAYSGAKADASDGVWDGDTSTVVLKLSKGDNVWITDGGVSVDYDSDFSGALIMAS